MLGGRLQASLLYIYYRARALRAAAPGGVAGARLRPASGLFGTAATRETFLGEEAFPGSAAPGIVGSTPATAARNFRRGFPFI
jgi:hypothetical protein